MPEKNNESIHGSQTISGGLVIKIMVCLISGQHVPNLLSIRSETPLPDLLVLIVTPLMKARDKHKQLLNALAAGGLDYGTRHDIKDLSKEDSISETYELLKKIYKDHLKDELVVNLTGGTKPMCIGAYEFCKEKNLRTLYVPEGNQREAIDLLRGSTVDLKHQLSIAEFLEGYGFSILNPSDLERSRERAENLYDLAALLTINSEDHGLRGMLGKIQSLMQEKRESDRKGWNREGLILTEDSSVYLEKEALRSKIAEKLDLETRGSIFLGSLEKHMVEFLAGKWLEVFVWGNLKPFIEDERIWDLNQGVRVGLAHSTDQRIFPGEDNDLDVAFMMNQSLCIGECKTGGQEHDPAGKDVLYKIEAIKSGLRALRVRTYLATTSDNVIDSQKGGVKEPLQRRADIYDCKIITGEKLRELAELYFLKSPRLPERVAEEFEIRKVARK